jgi:hypothetical protein
MSSDLPLQSLLQQRHARPVSPDELEMLGKKAAMLWSEGEYCNLTCAVTGAVKKASVPLSPEQVRRVVEFTNNEAYLREFRKEGGHHKIIDFGQDGPANTADVLRDLNDGGGKTAMDSGLQDYRRPPDEKRASQDDSALAAAFHVEAQDYPEENPLGDVIALRDKVAGAYDHVTDQISGLEIVYQDLSGRLYENIKQAALGGTSLGEVVQAWSAVSEEPAFVKAAFDQFVPRLFKEGIFSTLDEMGESLLKTAGARYVNPEHPLVQDYHDFCEALTKLAELREWQEELYQGHNKLSGFLSECMKKEAIPNLGEMAGTVSRGVAGAGEKYLGMTPEWAGRLGQGAVMAPAAIGAYGLYDYLRTHPAARFVPGTSAYNQKQQMRRQMQQDAIYRSAQ